MPERQRRGDAAGWALPLRGCVMEQEFYRGFADRVRTIAEKADPFTRRRLLDRPNGTTPKEARAPRPR
jgi:hypothetical protein